MKKALLATVALAALSLPAAAADIGGNGYVDPGPVAVQDSFDWTGFYAGVHGGYGGDKFEYPFNYFDDYGTGPMICRSTARRA